MRPAAGIPWPPPLQTTFARQGSSQTGLVTRESRLAGRYGPIFRTEAPLPVAEIPMVGVPIEVFYTGAHFAFLCWRLQAPGMEPRKGVVRFFAGHHGAFSNPLLVCDDYEWEML